ncbi:MAG: carbonic anhydrase [Bradymonadaceae bacterium]
MDDRYREVFENNRRWVASLNEQDSDYFVRLAAEQHPDFLFIGCSDSRVPANQIMGLDPGEVFVHRNIANLVVNTDINCQSVIQYAVEHLRVRHVVVCGHYGCGGIAAAMEPRDLGILNGWLREVRDVYRLHKEELGAITDMEQRNRRLVELNVHEQCRNVIKTAVVQKHYLRHGRPTVHGWVYDLRKGYLEDLEIPFEQTLESIQEIYRLDPSED